MTRLRFSIRSLFNVTGISLVVAVAILFIVGIWGHKALHHAHYRQNLAREVLAASLDLNILAGEFQLAPHPRIVKQWQDRMQSLHLLLIDMRGQPGIPASLVDGFQRQKKVLQEVFNGLVNRSEAAEPWDAPQLRARRVLFHRFLSATGALASLAHQTSSQAQQAALETEHRALTLGALSLLAIVGIALATHFIFLYRVLKPLIRLRGRILELGSDHASPGLDDLPTGITDRDEFAELDREFTARTEALMVSETRHRDLVEGSLQGIFVLSDGHFVFANQALARMFDFDEGQQIVDLGTPDILFGREVATSLPLWVERETAAGPSARNHEVSALRRDGRSIELLLLGRPVKWDGAPAQQFTVLDVTRERQAAKARQQFISTISHELRTPLTSIKGTLSVLSGGVAGALTPQQTEMLRIADRNVERLSLLVNDILDFEKMEFGPPVFKRQEIRIGRLIASALEENMGYAAEFGVKLTSDIFAPDVEVTGDWARLQQVLSNLISNAVKFSPKGDSVCVSARASGFRVEISVSDQGPGIAPENHDRIFEPFAQVDSTDARETYGTGLGLSISRKIVAAHGGEITVASNLGKGAIFTVTLPLKRPARPRVLPSAADDRAVAS